MFHLLLRRWRTKAAMANRMTITVTLATVMIVLLMKALDHDVVTGLEHFQFRYPRNEKIPSAGEIPAARTIL